MVDECSMSTKCWRTDDGEMGKMDLEEDVIGGWQKGTEWW
jgi:hypothetical protein